MKVWYQEGPLKQKFGAAGEFLIGQPKEIKDDLAADLLRKKRVMVWSEPGAVEKKGRK